MQKMFISANHPFCNSADILELKAIKEDIYTDFIITWMKKYDRNITIDIIHDIYKLFHENTYGVQKTFNELFAMTIPDDVITKDTLSQAVNNIIDSKEPLFDELLSNISDKQKPVLYAIAKEGEASGITSAAFIQKHKLASASTVQYATKQLIESGVITKFHAKYSVNEQFFDIWINRMYGNSTLLQQLEST